MKNLSKFKDKVNARNLLVQAMYEFSFGHNSAQEIEKSFIKNFTKLNSALMRMPTASEVGEMCVFLASDSASAITGQCINVDCGVLPQ